MSSPEVLDVRGHPCPYPVIALARTAAGRAAGTVLRVLADDPAAPGDVAAWCGLRGHRLVSRDVTGPHAVLMVELR